jgi:recombinational DNA repair ATPase RecF
MAVFWLKLYEKEKLGDKPLLLLDDLFSELDSDHRKKVEELVSGHVREGGQVVMTTTDERLVSGDLGWDIIHL